MKILPSHLLEPVPFSVTEIPINIRAMWVYQNFYLVPLFTATKFKTNDGFLDPNCNSL